MISATEALRLPSTQLTAAEQVDADALEQMIDERVRRGMTFRGINGVDLPPYNANTIAVVNQRLKAAGYGVEWEQVLEPNRFNRAAPPAHVGWRVSLSPTDESYRAAGEIATAIATGKSDAA